MKSRGFTLIELLVVIAIIGLLASVVLASLNEAREKARDAARMAQLKEISKALDLYYSDNGDYPHIQHGLGSETTCGSQTENWGHCDRLNDLTTALAPYLSTEPEVLSAANTNGYYFSYGSQGDDNWKTYGIMVYLETNAGANDGGYFSNAFELGEGPAYCMANYSGTNADWLNKPSDWGRRCAGGN